MDKKLWSIVSVVVMGAALVATLFVSDTAAQWIWNIVNLFFN